MPRYWLCFLIFVFSIPTQAEYRAFLLKITNITTQDVRLVKSNLDPQQYRTYYPIKTDESISYIDTWMCRGRTGEGRPICPSPRDAGEPAPQQKS